MPVRDSGGSEAFQDPFGLPTPPPAPPTAPPTQAAPPTIFAPSPTVSSTPSPGQGVALTVAGVLPPSAAASGLRMLAADPASPLVGEFWYRTDLDKLSVKTSSGVKRSSLFA